MSDYLGVLIAKGEAVRNNNAAAFKLTLSGVKI
jgi:hypothetical protein